MTKKAAALVTLGVALATNYAAMALVDFSFHRKRPVKNYSTGVLAVRDDVAGYQKMATKIFTKPYLKRMYDGFVYLEEKDVNKQEYQFIAGLTHLLMAHDSVDVFLLAHGNRMIDWVNRVDSNLRKKLRLVYNCGCNNARQFNEWARAGAKYYLGHKGAKSLSPVFFYFFIRRMADQQSLHKSIATANRHTRLVLGCIGFSKSKAEQSYASLYTF